VSDAVDYVLQAGEAIAEAHARGIVHRDLKPSNLFLTRRPDGSALVKVLDFGISKTLATEDVVGGARAEVSLTATRAVFGSPMYMSPEQVRSAKRVDERTDIWALGVILHELLTGASPFSGETMPGVLASIAADEPERLRRRRPEAPEGLETAILRALVKDVNERTQSVLDLGRMLLSFASVEGARSLERIERLSMPGGVSRRSLPQRLSSAPPPPSHPSQSMALGSTVRATTTGVVQATRRSPVLFALAAAVVLLVAYGTWSLRGSYDRAAPTVASSPLVAEPPSRPAAPPATPETAPPPPQQAAAVPPASPPTASSAAAVPSKRAHTAPRSSPSSSASGRTVPPQPAIDDPLNGR
jgi:serine/threonine-protein kinase